MTFQLLTNIIDDIQVENHHARLKIKDAMNTIKLYVGDKMRRNTQDLAINRLFTSLKKKYQNVKQYL